jgi:hypothetical protein
MVEQGKSIRRLLILLMQVLFNVTVIERCLSLYSPFLPRIVAGGTVVMEYCLQSYFQLQSVHKDIGPGILLV